MRWEFYRESRCLATCTEASLSKHMNLRNRQRQERYRKVMLIRLCVARFEKDQCDIEFTFISEDVIGTSSMSPRPVLVYPWLLVHQIIIVHA